MKIQVDKNAYLVHLEGLKSFSFTFLMETWTLIEAD